MQYARLGDYVNIKTGKLDANAAVENGQYPFFTCSKEISSIDSYSYDTECVLVAGNGDLNVKYYNGKFDAYQRTYIIENKENSIFYVKYIYYFMSRYILELKKQTVGGIIKFIKLGNLTEAKIPIYSKEKQKDIIDFFDNFNSTITNKIHELEILDNLIKSQFIEMFGDPIINNMSWKLESIENLCNEIYGGGTPSKSHPEYYENGDIFWVSSKDMKSEIIKESKIKINQLGLENSSAKLVPINSVVMVIRSGILKHTLPVAVNVVPITVNQDLKVFIPGKRIVSKFLLYLFKMLEKDILSGVRAVTADNIEFDSFRKRYVIVPNIELQDQFAAVVEQIDKSKYILQKQIDALQELLDSKMEEFFG